MTTNETNAKISARILALVGQGKTPREAFDLVLGAGAYEALASATYEALRAKGGAK